MSTQIYISVITIAVVVLGWFVNGILQRRHEIAKKRIDSRLEILESYIPIASDARQSKIDAVKIVEFQIKMLFFGYQDEIDLVNQLLEAVLNEDTKQISLVLNKLSPLMRNRLRKELKLPELQSV